MYTLRRDAVKGDEHLPKGIGEHDHRCRSRVDVAFERELGAQLGRTKRNFRLWQDQEAIAPGKDWEAEITRAVEQSVFFIPIVTPRAVSSDYCRFEFSSFIAREGTLGRSDLIFPILWISVPALLNEAEWREDPVLSIVAKRQHVDWRSFRHDAVNSPALAQAIERLCTKIVETLRERSLSREERRQFEAEAPKRAEEQERVFQEAEAKKQGDEQDAKRRREEAQTQRRPAQGAEPCGMAVASVPPRCRGCRSTGCDGSRGRGRVVEPTPAEA